MRGLLLVVLLLLLLIGSSFGAGFGLYEFGGRASALSGAVVAQSSDASTIFYNPAGLVHVGGTQFYGGVTMLTAKNRFIGPGIPNSPVPASTTVHDAKSKWHPPVGIYFSHNFSEDLAFGIGLTNPYGLGLAWEDDFPGRVVSREVDLKSFYISPVVSYKLSFIPGMSIAAGADIVYSTIFLERNILFPEDSHPGSEVGSLTLDGDSKVAFGFSGGLMYKFNKLSLGLLYRHQVKNEFEGDATFDIYDKYKAFMTSDLVGAVDQIATAEITYPSLVSVGAHYQLSEKFGFEVDYIWSKWEVFDVLELKFEKEALNTEIKEEYSNSWQIRLGAHYQLTDALEIRAGYVYDQTPQPKESMSPLLPDNDRNDGSFGIGYKWNNMQFDLGYMLVDFGERSTLEDGQGKHFDGFNGTYASRAHLFFFSYGISL